MSKRARRGVEELCPFENYHAITKSDTTDEDQEFIVRATGTGNLKVRTAGGQDVTIVVADGECFPLWVKRVWDTGTTATGLQGWF